MTKMRRVQTLLVQEESLPPELKDHPLKGEWAGSRDCHLEPDWVLIYTLEKPRILFERTGSHSDLFGN